MRSRGVKKVPNTTHSRCGTTWDGNVSQQHRFDSAPLHIISSAPPVQHIVASVQLNLCSKKIKMVIQKSRKKWELLMPSVQKSCAQTNPVLAPVVFRDLHPPVYRVCRLTLIILNLQQEGKRWEVIIYLYFWTKPVIQNTYKELKVDAGVGVEILKEHGSRFLQGHSVGQRCRALVCVWGYVFTFRCPGWARKTSAAETVWEALRNL